MKLKEAAKWYRDKCGFSVIPLRLDKKPKIAWEEFQKRKATDEEIETWFANGEGICMLGIVTGTISNISVVDVDNIRGKEFVSELLDSNSYGPTVGTPRGGFHIYYRYKEGLRNKARIADGVDIRSEGGYVVAPPSINMEGKKYKWISKPTISIGSIDRIEFPEVLLKYMVMQPKEVVDANEMFTEGRRDEDLFHVANALVKAGLPSAEVKEVTRRLANSCEPPFPEQEIDAKVKSAMDRDIRREKTLLDDVRDWIKLSSGIFISSEVSKALCLNTRDDIKNLSKALNQLVDEGIIEKYGRKSGVFRKVERTYKSMDWISANIKPLNISYPLGLQHVFSTYAKNAIVVAGTKDSGKTAFMLDFIKRNMENWNIHYFTNEMGEEELHMRLSMHKDIDLEDWKFKAYELGGVWEDIVQPDDITIIDYVELNDAFYQVGEVIKKMHERLNKGLLLIGLQKDYGTLLGRGRAFSLQRPRLYLTLDSGYARIISAKNRASGVNAKGMVLKYHIEDGWKIMPLDKWHYPTQDEKKFLERKEKFYV